MRLLTACKLNAELPSGGRAFKARRKWLRVIRETVVFCMLNRNEEWERVKMCP